MFDIVVFHCEVVKGTDSLHEVIMNEGSLRQAAYDSYVLHIMAENVYTFHGTHSDPAPSYTFRTVHNQLWASELGSEFARQMLHRHHIVFREVKRTFVDNSEARKAYQEVLRVT